jgi:hypothetical protein
MPDKSVLLTTAQTMFYVRYNAAELAILMAKHDFPLPANHPWDRAQFTYWDQDRLDEWVLRRQARLLAGASDSSF